MSPEAEAIARVLLEHRKSVSRGEGKREGLDACLLTYGELCERARLPGAKPAVGKLLREIAVWCHENGWPPLNALAVNHDTRRPGHGYDRAPGCSLAGWRAAVEACLEFKGYPDVGN
ncbi:MAG TPA: hypothetical protein VNN77_02585 [candidate division Zixibacteria bacterium]|nr:hypothetical protein [candidate division Zixibacteria bacterium]